jgi:hypothetical protein
MTYNDGLNLNNNELRIENAEKEVSEESALSRDERKVWELLEATKTDPELTSILAEMDILKNKFEARLAELRATYPEKYKELFLRSTSPLPHR